MGSEMCIRDSLMSVTLRWVPSKTESQVPITTFLLPAAEVTTFCRYLLMMKYTSISLFDYVIDVPEKHSRSVQRRLLQPFAMLKEDLLVQNVQIRGELQESLVNRVRSAMTQEVGWARGRLWSIHDSIYHFAKLADQSFNGGDFAVCLYCTIKDTTLANLDIRLQRQSIVKSSRCGPVTMSTVQISDFSIRTCPRWSGAWIWLLPSTSGYVRWPLADRMLACFLRQLRM